jgi:hypothetical protein
MIELLIAFVMSSIPGLQSDQMSKEEIDHTVGAIAKLRDCELVEKRTDCSLVKFLME